MSRALDRIRRKLGPRIELTRVVVPPYPAIRDGKRVMVDGYSYERKGGKMVPGSRQVLKAGDSVPGQPGARKLDEAIARVRGQGQRKTFGDYAKEADSGSSPVRSIPNAPATKPKGVDSGSGTKEDPWVTGDVNAAALALSKDEYVQLKQKKQVSTLLDKLGTWAKEAEANGDKAPTFDLCKVSVPKTNLFCAENKGVPRVEMPQFSGKPTPGSRADREFTKDKKGEVNLSEAFAQHLAQQGIDITDEQYDPAFLKASQREMRGGKVGSMMKSLRDGSFDDSAMRLWVANDDYVIDGHHRWAAHVGIEAGGQQHKVPIRRVNADIITILGMARDWTEEMGLAGADV